jgi:carbamoyltransferase
MLIVGVNAFHGDSSACLVRDGKLVAAAEEERFRRTKHWAGFPTEAIRYCLEAAGVAPVDVDYFAINQDSHANILRKVAYAVTQRPRVAMVLDRLRNRDQRSNLFEYLARTFPSGELRGELRLVEHHLAHLSSAFHVSPFERAVAISVDGFGDFASAAWGVGEGASLHVDGRVYFPHSLGVFYQAMTQYIGFPQYGDEYKVMGLAPYGQPRFVEELANVVRVLPDGSFELGLEFFRHQSEKITYEWEDGTPIVGRLFSPELEQLLGPARDKTEPLQQRHKDIARSVQATYEQAFFNLLNMVYRKYNVDSLTLSGGCAMNSVANGKVYGNTPFKRLYVQSAAGDAGGAIGAAFVVWHEVNSAGSRFSMDHAYWGPGFTQTECDQLIASYSDELRAGGCTVTSFDNPESLTHAVARAIAEGNVVGWFQGRMEWGPRALGNRSIVCDPRRPDMKDILNLKIKRRESFRPFAPSILREFVAEWFEENDDVPFMMQVYPIRPAKRALVPAVTHVDGTGRLQTVTRETNPLYYCLIDAFRARTGVPMVLNTSFNENEPIVCRPEEALACFLRTRMDGLALGTTFVTRTGN